MISNGLHLHAYGTVGLFLLSRHSFAVFSHLLFFSLSFSPLPPIPFLPSSMLSTLRLPGVLRAVNARLFSSFFPEIQVLFPLSLFHSPLFVVRRLPSSKSRGRTSLRISFRRRIWCSGPPSPTTCWKSTGTAARAGPRLVSCPTRISPCRRPPPCCTTPWR